MISITLSLVWLEKAQPPFLKSLSSAFYGINDKAAPNRQNAIMFASSPAISIKLFISNFFVVIP
ncbi:hypothetical protein NEOC95_001888 [Neochlamydia sp. AcF95]|nr:hypothetical protein [Neochlamydia sp. AcF95]